MKFFAQRPRAQSLKPVTGIDEASLIACGSSVSGSKAIERYDELHTPKELSIAAGALTDVFISIITDISNSIKIYKRISCD
jgi:hypothetical protein